MKKTVIDATDVTQKALLGTDGGWYEAYWFGDGAEPKPRLLTRLADQLAIVGRAMRQLGRSFAGLLSPRSNRFGGLHGSKFRPMT